MSDFIPDEPEVKETLAGNHVLRRFLTVLFGAWMLGLSLFFFLRFSFVFYFENEEAIRAFFSR
ncbi:MAG: hypothetical protein RLZZ303_2320 [Candidatus Hydrogenedentota bacterium]